MSISKVEFRLFSGPAQVDLGGLDKPTIVELRFGPKGDKGDDGDTGPAGPNTVTSATTSDGTANLSLSNVSTATATVSSLLTANHIHGNLAGTLYTHVRTGEAVSKGDPVYVSGFHAGTGQPIVMRADASDAGKMPAIGVMDADYLVNVSSANCVIAGTITSVDTDAFSINSPVYVGNGGGFSENIGTIPQQVGIVERSNQNTGAFVVTNNKVISSADISDFTTAVEAIAPNAVTSATTSDGTASLDISNLTLSQAITSGLQTKMTFAAQPTTVGDGQQIIWQWYNGGSPLTTAVIATEATSSNSDKLLFKTSESGSLATSLDLNNSLATFSGVVSSFGSTYQTGSTFTYGTGAAAAHRDALDIASADLQIESLFTLLTFQESDAGSYTANGGSAAANQDGDTLSLSATTANQRPNVYRFRNWSRNPGNSGASNPVTPLRLASAGNIVHSGSGANGASFRCGIGMVNGASAVAADANATTGRGFGWRIAWNSSTSKLEFNLWAHNGTTYVEGTGIDTGLSTGSADNFFNVIVRLASDGTVTAHTWFGTNTAIGIPSATPSATLAGGPTSGTFANQGIPVWISAAHSTNAPSGANSIIAKIINRKLYIG